MMDKTFATMINGKLVIIYMDNILILGKTKEELRQTMRMVLEKLLRKQSIPQSKEM